MVKCLNCGETSENDANYCSYCGSNITSDINYNISRKQKNQDVSLLLAIILPGISYFYLGLWKRGILYYSSFILIFIVVAVKAGFYNNIELINTQVLLLTILIFFLLVYVYQIFDVVRKTMMINNS